MTTLVTGGAGYIGSHMVLDLLETGEKIVILDDLSTGFPWLVPQGVTFVEGDIGDKALLSKVISNHQIDAIAHFAAKIVVPDSMSDPLGYYLNNTSKARTLIEAAVDGGVKHFIFSSTAAVYGETREMPVTEDSPPAPVSPYGRSKLMVEWMLEDASRAYGLNAMILRYFNVAGADPRGRSGQATPRATHLIKTAAEAATGRRAGMSIFGTDYPTPDGTCIRDYIHIGDLVSAHILAVEAIAPEACEKYGVIDGKVGSRIQGIVEKPTQERAPSNLGVVGRYILQPTIFEALTQIYSTTSNGELQLTDAIDIVSRKEPVYAYSFLGDRYDCGDKLGYLKAVIALGSKHPVIGAAFRAYLTSIAVTS